MDQDRRYQYYGSYRKHLWNRNIGFYGNDVFKESKLVSIVIPEGVTDIGNNAFEDCFKLAGVQLPVSLVRMGSGAFSSCISLEDVSIPSGSKIIFGRFIGNYNAPDSSFINGINEYFENGQTDYDSSFLYCHMIKDDFRKALNNAGYKGKFDKMNSLLIFVMKLF